jgi:hypothetical protein
VRKKVGVARITASLETDKTHLCFKCIGEPIQATSSGDGVELLPWRTDQLDEAQGCKAGNQRRPAVQPTPYSDSPDFKPDGSWDKKTRRIGVNARLFDDFDAASAPVTVIDGKHLW